MSNSLKISRMYKENNRLSDLSMYEVAIGDNQDLVIKGLGFIKFKKGCRIKMNLKKGVKYFVRDSIV